MDDIREIDMEEIRIDLRQKNEARSAETRRTAKAVYRFNQLEPYTEESVQAMYDIFTGGIGEGSSVHSPVFLNIGKNIHIGSNAWIGAGSTILPGVTVGENAIVGASSVVTKDVAQNAVVAGNPVRIIKVLDADKFKKAE